MATPSSDSPSRPAPAPEDFPAAHSMDTFWFAVDESGAVALFFSGSSGFVPHDADAVAAADLVAVARAGGAVPGGATTDNDIVDWDTFLDSLVGLGIYNFEYIDSFDDPDGLLQAYTLRRNPGEALHLDELPPSARAIIGGLRFASVTFGEEPAVQPLDFWRCATWGDEWSAYLSADEARVRPLPEHKDRYHDFCEEHEDTLRANHEGVFLEGFDGGEPE